MQTTQQRPDRLTEEAQKRGHDDAPASKPVSGTGARRPRRSDTEEHVRHLNPVKGFVASLTQFCFIAVALPLTLLAEATGAFLILIGGIYGFCLIVIGCAGLIQAFGAVLEFLHLA